MRDKEKGEKLFNAICENQTEEALSLIKDPTTDPNWCIPNLLQTCLHVACLEINLPVVQALMGRKDILPCLRGLWGNQPLHLACLDGSNFCISTRWAETSSYKKWEIVKVLVSDPRVVLNQINDQELTPFNLACDYYYKEKEVVLILLASSPKIGTENIPDGWMNTAAQRAKRRGFSDLHDLIVRYNKDPEEVMIELRKQLKIPSLLLFLFLLCFHTLNIKSKSKRDMAGGKAQDLPPPFFSLL